MGRNHHLAAAMSDWTKHITDGGACFGKSNYAKLADLDVSVICKVEIWMMALSLGNLLDMVKERNGCTQPTMAPEDFVQRSVRDR